MPRTVKLSYQTSPEAQAVIAEWRRVGSRIIRVAYNRVRDEWADKTILDSLRSTVVSQQALQSPAADTSPAGFISPCGHPQ